MRNMSSGKQTDLVLLDFFKAFDKVNHSKLLLKLHQYGIRGAALAWIHAFLGNWSQTVVLGGEESGSVPVTSEGSVVAWWLIHRTPDPEVGGSSPTRVKS